MLIKDAIDIYRLIGGEVLAQLFTAKLSYSSLYEMITELLLKKLLVPVKHEFIGTILDDLIHIKLIKKSFWTGKYELTFEGRQKVINDILSNKEELKL